MRGCRENQELQKGHKWIRPPSALFCALIAVSPSLMRAAETGGGDETTGPLTEIVVTATRHEESLSRVPISVTAMSQEALEIRGVKDFEDVSRFTPGVDIDNSGTNNISI